MNLTRTDCFQACVKTVRKMDPQNMHFFVEKKGYVLIFLYVFNSTGVSLVIFIEVPFYFLTPIMIVENKGILNKEIHVI